ncbi:MAG: lysoplasmalogenase [Erysipelotrichaceae bacterium]|nr:lysoplasmalogenase [Erysipelotrichaceae bacterium]
MMKYVMLCLFIIFTTLHLYASLKNDKPFRDKTKPFILLSLMGFYCFSVEKIEIFVLLALLFSWLGDLLLIPKGIKWFATGGVSFLIGHIFFILAYNKYIDFSLINELITILLPFLFIVIALIVFKYLRPHLPKGLFYPMLIYLITNGLMNCFAWFRALCTTGISSIITALGALLFFVSDSSLFFVRFDKNSLLKTHFLVMLTYSLGEFLIILGLIIK